MTESPYCQRADLGLSSLVSEDFSPPQIKLNYAGSSSGSYPGFDRLDRVQQQLWRSYAAGGADVDKLDFGFDRDSNPLDDGHAGLGNRQFA